jgi:hypothetical protein
VAFSWSSPKKGPTSDLPSPTQSSGNSSTAIMSKPGIYASTLVPEEGTVNRIHNSKCTVSDTGGGGTIAKLGGGKLRVGSRCFPG